MKGDERYAEFYVMDSVGNFTSDEKAMWSKHSMKQVRHWKDGWVEERTQNEDKSWGPWIVVETPDGKARDK